MTMDKKEPAAEMVEKEARRKIIKGLAGLPAVMTLGSGTANAVASVYECAAASADVTDRVGNPLELYSPTLNTDLSGNTVNDADCVDFGTVVTPPQGAPTQTNVLWDNSNTLTVSPVRTSVDTDLGPGTNDKACVVFVDANGQTVHSTQEANTLPVTASCYVSFTQ